MGAGPEQWDDVERVGAELGGEAIRLWASIRIYISPPLDTAVGSYRQNIKAVFIS